jgi:drug/metabolite transporter (DMT)-like permease
MSDKRKGILFSVLTSLMLGFLPVLMVLVLELVNVETMNVVWSGFSSVFFVLFFVLAKKRHYFVVLFRNWKKLSLLGLLGTVGFLLYTYGLLLAGPVNAGFLLQFTAVFTIIFGVVFLKERFTRQEGLGIVAAVVGVFVLAYGHFDVELVSTVAVLCAAVLFASSNLISKVYVKNINPISLAGGNALFEFLFLFAYAALFGKLQVAIPTVAFAYSVVGAFVGGFLGFVLFFKALDVYEVSKVASIRTAEPFLTAIFSFAVLALAPTVNQLAGGILIVVGVITLSLAKQNKHVDP